MTKLTLQDVNKYIALIRVNFENAYKAQSDAERKMLIRSWYEILKEYPKEVCDRAVVEAIKNAEFAPRIGAIVKEIERMQMAYEKGDGELWSELTGCLCEVARNVYAFRFDALESNGRTQGENARQRVAEIFEGLSSELREYVRNPRGLIELAEYDDEQISYERGRFMRNMPGIKERMKMRSALPVEIGGLLCGSDGRLMLANVDEIEI